jgi:hypothetical protein
VMDCLLYLSSLNTPDLVSWSTLAWSLLRLLCLIFISSPYPSYFLIAWCWWCSILAWVLISPHLPHTIMRCQYTLWRMKTVFCFLRSSACNIQIYLQITISLPACFLKLICLYGRSKYSYFCLLSAAICQCLRISLARVRTRCYPPPNMLKLFVFLKDLSKCLLNHYSWLLRFFLSFKPVINRLFFESICTHRALLRE